MKMNNQFIGIEQVYEDQDFEDWLWHESGTNLWKPVKNCCGWHSNIHGVHSFKAARRHLRKHNEIPKGTKFLLVSRFVGYDRILVKK